MRSRFGGRVRETHRGQPRQGALARPNRLGLMGSRKTFPSELRERAMKMVVELRAESGARGCASFTERL